MQKTVIISETARLIEGEGPFFENLADGAAYYEHNMGVLRRFTPKGGRAYDIGANFGLMSLSIADLAGQIIAIEAGAQTFKHLTKNTETCDNIIAIKALVGVNGSKKTFLSNALEPGGSTSVAVGGAPPGHDYLKKTAVTAKGLDELVALHGKPDVIKIDVEGAEIEVLRSAQHTLAEHKPVCLIEFNSLCLMNFGRINPPEALEYIRSVFPYVCVVVGNHFSPIKDNYAFIMNNVLYNHSVNDLLCTFDPPPESL